MKTHRNVVVLMIWMAASAYFCPALPAGENYKTLDRALKYYEECRYRRALYYFEKADKEAGSSEEAKFIRYAIKIIKRSEDPLREIEMEELAARDRRGGPARPVSPELATRHFLFAASLMKQNFYLPLIEPHLKRAIELEPENIEAHLYLAEAYYDSMRYKDAIKEFERVISLDPRNSYAYKVAGDACVAAGDFESAKRFYAGLVKVNPGSAVKYEESVLKKIKEVMNKRPGNYTAVDRLIAERKNEEAEKELKKYIFLNPADSVAMAKLGTVYEKQDDRNKARRLYQAAIDINPDYPAAHLFLGRLFFLTRDYDKAVAEFKLFKRKTKLSLPMNEIAKGRYINDLYYISHAYFTLKMYEEMRQELEEIISLDPKAQDAYYNLGFYYYIDEHNRSRAYNLFQKAIELNPASETADAARYAIEFIRSNPDSRVEPDFSFIDNGYQD